MKVNFRGKEYKLFSFGVPKRDCLALKLYVMISYLGTLWFVNQLCTFIRMTFNLCITVGVVSQATEIAIALCSCVGLVMSQWKRCGWL